MCSRLEKGEIPKVLKMTKSKTEIKVEWQVKMSHRGTKVNGNKQETQMERLAEVDKRRCKYVLFYMTIKPCDILTVSYTPIINKRVDSFI